MPEVDTTASRVNLRTAGPLLFHPEGILFVADVASAAIYALDVEDEPTSSTDRIEIEHLDAKLASLLGVERGDVVVRGMAVHPVSHAVYFSVARGHGADATAAVVRVDAGGVPNLVDLNASSSARVDLDDAPSADSEAQDVWLDGSDESSETKVLYGVELGIARIPLGRSTITDLAWVDGALFVAGTSDEEFTSRLRRIPFPFGPEVAGTSLEIYHVDHGKYETASPIRALIPFDGGRSILATYTCTPVVHFPVADLKADALVRGRTVAELGPMNQPLGLVAYEHDGQEYLLVSGTRHPLLRIPAASIAGQAPLTEHLEPVGVPREALSPAGVTLMANLDRTRIVVLQRDGDATHLRTLQAAEL